MRSWAYNRFGVLMGASWRASALRWPRLREDIVPMITPFPSQGYFCATAPSGMLVVGKIPKKRRRPHAILHPTAPILLWHRLARSHDVSLHLEPGWRDSRAPQYARWARTISQGH